MEGRRQFIPREAGDPELTQAELDAQKDSQVGNLSRIMRSAAFATMLGAAALSPEAMHAQQPELEKQNVEQMHFRMSDGMKCESWVSGLGEAHPTLKPFLKNARVEEAEIKPEAEDSERTFYVYLPSTLYKEIFVIKLKTNQFESGSDDGVQIHFWVGLEKAMRDNGLIEFVKSPDGAVYPIPNVLEGPSSHLIERVGDEIRQYNLRDVNEHLPRIISELEKRQSIVDSLKEPTARHFQLPTPAQEEYPAIRTVDTNMPNISDAGDALLQRIDLAIQRNDYQALRFLPLTTQRLLTSLHYSQELEKGDRLRGAQN
jgi:hypothetical protein